jgi:diguanylate cyclase (GGDEF)-like protein
VSVALVDIDGFKAINDVHGHPGGDLLLIDLARLWAEVLRPDDVLARIGGDEFAVLLPDCTEPRGGAVLERLRAQMPTPYTCSVGIAKWDRAELADQLIVRADNALYEAKRSRHDHPATNTRYQPSSLQSRVVRPEKASISMTAEPAGSVR